MKDANKVTMGKKSKKSGGDFERRVRKDLESKGWIVDKWSNNIKDGKLVPAKQKFRGPGLPFVIGTGFPDFLCFKFYKGYNGIKTWEMMGVESKTNGILDKEEKEKCKWLLKNNIFSKILIASKTKVKNRVIIKYEDFEK